MPPPLFAQAKDDTCAFACLRMILAERGVQVAEEELAARAGKPIGGLEIEDLQRRAQQYGVEAEIVQLDTEDIAASVAAGVYPIVYLNRVYFDPKFPLDRRRTLRTAIVHAVVPIRATARFITFHDPYPPGSVRRATRRRFDAAQRDLAHWCVVCKPG